MRVDDLEDALASARAGLPPTDVAAGRHEVDRRIRRHRIQTAGMVLLVVVLLVGAGVALAARGTDEQRVISGPDGIPRYLPDPLPEGPIELQTFPAPAGAEVESRGTTEWIVWTDSADDRLSLDDRLILLSSSLAARGEAGVVQVVDGERGARGYRSDQEGRSFRVESVGVDAEDAKSVLVSATVATGDRLGAEPPAGFREVFRRRADLERVQFFIGTSMVTDATADGYTAVVGGPDSGAGGDALRPSFSAFVVHRSFEWSHAVATPLEWTDVGGMPGYLRRLWVGSQTDGSEPERVNIGVEIVWWVTDDVVLSVSAPTEDEARRLAELMRAVDEATWDAFVRSTSPPREPPTVTSMVGTISPTTTTVP